MTLTRRRGLAALGGALASSVACQRSQKPQVAVIPKATSHLFWLAVQAGAYAAGDKFNVEVLWNGPSQETDFARQIQIVDSMIARRVNGIVLAACDRKALVAPVERAQQAKIPVTVFDSGLDSSNYMSYVATDNVEAGRMAARTMGKLLGGKGTVGVVMHVPGSVSTMDREKGFEEVIESDFPGIRIAQKLYGMSDRSKARAAAENILTAHPDLTGLFASTEPSATGAALAVKARNLQQKVALVGFDSSDAMVDDLRDGVIDALVVQDPFKIGFEAVRTIAERISGKTPPARMDLAATVVTRDNLEQPEIRRLVSPDLSRGASQ